MSDIHVTYDGDTHWLQCFSDDPSAEKGVIVDPIDIGDSWVTLAEKVAEHQAQHGCAPKPEPAKVIIVTEVGGRERHYDANGWDAEDAVDVTRDGEVIATYPPGAWTRIHREGATLPDVTARKLGLAMQALRDIANTVLEADDKRRVPVGAARDALEQIADVDL